MRNSSTDHNTYASKAVGLVHTLVHKTFPTPVVHTITSFTKTKWKSLKRMCCQVWSLQLWHARAQASLAVPLRCLRIVPTTGRLARSPDSRSLLRTVWPEILTFARPCVLQAVSTAIIKRLGWWKRRKCMSGRCDVTRGLQLRDLSIVLPVCWRRIISREMVILDTVKLSVLPRPGESFQPEPYPRWLTVILTDPWYRRSCENFNFQNGKIVHFCWQHN